MTTPTPTRRQEQEATRSTLFFFLFSFTGESVSGPRKRCKEPTFHVQSFELVQVGLPFQNKYFKVYTIERPREAGRRRASTSGWRTRATRRNVGNTGEGIAGNASRDWTWAFVLFVVQCKPAVKRGWAGEPQARCRKFSRGQWWTLILMGLMGSLLD